MTECACIRVCASIEDVPKERPGPSLVPFFSELGSPAVIDSLRALIRDALSVGTASSSPVIFSACVDRGIVVHAPERMAKLREGEDVS